MSRQAAPFQTRSVLTGTGFTTRESESAVDQPVRRHVVLVLVLLGNAGPVAVASSLILGFRGATTAGQGWRAPTRRRPAGSRRRSSGLWPGPFDTAREELRRQGG